ncbi:MAG: hypothetical protein ACPLPS_09910 [bacterium]
MRLLLDYWRSQEAIAYKNLANLLERRLKSFVVGMGKNRFNILRYFLTVMNAQHSSRELLAIPDIPLLG